MATEFFVDASGSSDPSEPVTSLRVRWDWEGDGSWDTGYVPEKMASHRYVTPGPKTILVEVVNTAGLLGTTSRTVTVARSLVCNAVAAPEAGTLAHAVVRMVPVCKPAAAMPGNKCAHLLNPAQHFRRLGPTPVT